jgi:hypothetical protein
MNSLGKGEAVSSILTGSTIKKSSHINVCTRNRGRTVGLQPSVT